MAISPSFLLELAQLEAKYPEAFAEALSGPHDRFASRLLDLFCEDGKYPENAHWSFEGYEKVIQYYNMRRDELDRESN